MKTVALITILFLALVFSGCKKDDTNYNNKDMLVVEAYLYDGLPVENIKLSKTLSIDKGSVIFQVVPDATVSILKDDVTYNLVPSDEEGYYNYPGDDLSIEENESYRILISYNSEVVEAQTIVPEKSPAISADLDTVYIDTDKTMWELMEEGMPSIEITWDNPDNDYFYMLIENLEEDPENIELSADGGGFPGGPGGPGRFRFMSRPFQGDTYHIALFGEVYQYGKHRAKLYRVNQEYADLYENRIQDSRYLSEPLTNIKNGLGIFTAFSEYSEVYFYVLKE